MKSNTSVFILFLIVSLSLNSCKSVKEFVIDSPETREVAMQTFASDVFKFIIQDKKLILDNYIPSIEMVREIAMAEAEGKDDTEISEMVTALKNRLIENAEKARNDIKSNGFSLNQTEFNNAKSYPEDTNGHIEVMSIELKNGNNKGSIPVTYTFEEGRFYLMEILMSTNIMETK